MAMKKLEALVESSAQVERIATGFLFAEGPVWANDGSLYFSDMPADARRRWHPGEGPSIIRSPANKCNGMTFDSRGDLIVCEHSTSRVMREAPDGTVSVVASHFQGRELNSPNDVIVASDDSIIFTDPDWGRTMAAVGIEREVQLDFRGVFRVAAEGGEPVPLVRDFDGPNGLCLSPDEKRLYVNDSARAHIRVFDVGPGFELSNDRIFASDIGIGFAGEGIVDGMKADRLGNIYVTGPSGIWVFSPNGEKLGVIDVPETTSNLNWGGDGWQDLFITATSSVYRVRMKIAGNPLPYMKRHSS